MNIPVRAASHSYEVVIGASILQQSFDGLQKPITAYDKVVVLTDENVWQAQRSYFEANTSFSYELLVMPAGEACKSFENFMGVQSFLIDKKCTRKSLIVAFGGGAVGDLAGFAAATYMRGIDFIQVPTTILAHDSAVGGKTAINLPQAKNIVGAFFQPQAVLYDTTFLASLSDKEVRSGMTEVVKHAMISDATWLADLMSRPVVGLSQKQLADDLAKGIQVKAKIVEEDETEQSVRKYLNLGHTYGHAIEAAAGYGGLAHGEAVMIGLVYCLLLSERYGTITRNFTEQFLAYAQNNGYPFEAVAKYDFDELLNYMLKDKKADFGELQFVLLQSIGQPFVQKVSADECRDIDTQFRQMLGV
jgi:3-dehydroquinate synthase